jgi:hypothetical protein
VSGLNTASPLVPTPLGPTWSASAGLAIPHSIAHASARAHFECNFFTMKSPLI